MKYLILITLIFVTQILIGQTLGKQYYDESPPAYVPPPIQEYKEMFNKAEQQYYKNREACNEIENYILKELQKLKVDTLNIAYRNGLKQNLETIKSIKTAGDYENHTMEIIETAENLQKNQLNYQDENEIILRDMERKLKIQEEENQKLKSEMELNKAMRVNSKKKNKK